MQHMHVLVGAQSFRASHVLGAVLGCLGKEDRHKGWDDKLGYHTCGGPPSAWQGGRHCQFACLAALNCMVPWWVFKHEFEFGLLHAVCSLALCGIPSSQHGLMLLLHNPCPFVLRHYQQTAALVARVSICIPPANSG